MLSDINNSTPFCNRPVCIIFLMGLLVVVSGCAMISDPEKSGGEIIAVPEGPWCSFSISGDGKWLQYVGNESPYLNPDAKNSSHQRKTFLADLETGETYFAEPDPDVQNRITEGLGPDGLGCFGPDQSKLYFTTVDWSSSTQNEQQSDEIRNDSSLAGRLTTPSRQRDRYHFVVDLTTKPFVIRQTDHRECADRPDAVKPDIYTQSPSDKVVELYSNDGQQLARHRPRGWFNSISIWDPDQHQWELDYSLSPDGNYLVYRISERGLIGFSAPTHGYLLNLSPKETQESVFLAASVYSMEWDNRRNFYACTSHSKHRRVIAKWSL